MFGTHRALVAATLCVLAATVVSAAATDGSTTAANAIIDSYKAGDGATWHELVVEQLTADRSLTPEALDLAIGKYVTVASSRGVEALLPLIVSDQAELAHRSAQGATLATGNLESIGALKVVTKPIHPNALAPLVRPGNPTVHHLPIGVVQQLATTSVVVRTFDLDGLLDDALCSPQGQKDFAARYGPELAAALADLCAGTNVGALDGGTGLGTLAGLSNYDCVDQHQPTRAEKFEGAMFACLQSIVGGQSNPFADGGGAGSEFVQVLPTRESSYTTTGVDPTTGKILWQTDFDRQGQAIVTTTFNGDGTRKETYYDEQEVQVVQIEYGENGEMTKGTATTPEGGTETVVIKPDNSYTVTETDASGKVIREQSYDQNGKPVPPPATTDKGDEWGSTTPECRAFALLAIEERFDAAAEVRGVRPEVINPNPDAPVEPGEELDCLSVDAGNLVGGTLGCADTLVHCALGQVLDSKCACTTPTVGMTPTDRCDFAMMCPDGDSPKETDGQCTCPDPGAIFDPAAGGGPQPLPIDGYDKK